MKVTKLVLVSLVMCCLAVVANAAMIGTYVDANGGSGGNTVNASNSSLDDWYTSANSDTDNLWAFRSSSNHGEDDIYEANTPGENCPTLKTTITGLTPGQSYEVRVIFDSENDTRPAGTDWDISAGLAADSLTMYRWGDGFSEETGIVVEDRVNDWDVLLMQALVGTVTADAAGEIAVFIDKTSAGGRARYDGVTYLEVPEPMTMSLLAAGGLGMLIRRKR